MGYWYSRISKAMIGMSSLYAATEFRGELIDSPEGKLEWIPDNQLHNLNLWERDHILFPWI
jgi:8-oxo-dGTP diphosphatase